MSLLSFVTYVLKDEVLRPHRQRIQNDDVSTAIENPTPRDSSRRKLEATWKHDARSHDVVAGDHWWSRTRSGSAMA